MNMLEMVKVVRQGSLSESTETNGCSEDLCTTRKTLYWRHLEETCFFKFACNGVSKDICGHYGVNLVFESDVTMFCFEDQVIR